MCEVVGEDHVSNLVLLDISNDVTVEIAEIDDMHLFKGIEKMMSGNVVVRLLPSHSI